MKVLLTYFSAPFSSGLAQGWTPTKLRQLKYLWKKNDQIRSTGGIRSNSSSLLNMDSNNAALNEVYLRIPISAKQKFKL